MQTIILELKNNFKKNSGFGNAQALKDCDISVHIRGKIFTQQLNDVSAASDAQGATIMRTYVRIAIWKGTGGNHKGILKDRHHNILRKG